jgi:hypothetical protein
MLQGSETANGASGRDADRPSGAAAETGKSPEIPVRILCRSRGRAMAFAIKGRKRVLPRP